MPRVTTIIVAALSAACVVGVTACSSTPSGSTGSGDSPSATSAQTAPASESVTGSSGPPRSTSATGKGAPTTAQLPKDAAASRSIRDVDFANHSWWDDADHQTITLRKGAWKGTVNGFPDLVELIDSKAVAKKYVDIDGDGFDDALLTLRSTQGNGAQIATYVWRWDPLTSKAVQVRPRLTDDARCGDVTTAVTPAGASQIKLTILDGTKAKSCATPSSVKLRKTVKIVDGLAMEVKPYPSARIRCFIGAATDDFFDPEDLGGGVLRAAPTKSSPVVARAADLAGWGEVKGDERAVPKGWLLLWYLPKALVGKGSERLPCGFAPRG